METLTQSMLGGTLFFDEFTVSKYHLAASAAIGRYLT
jgi:hypothetical protein